MRPNLSVCLLLGIGFLLLPQALQVSLAQTDATEQQNRSIRCTRCSVVYPEEARLSGSEGIVGLLIDIDADGRVTNVLLSRSSGYFLLDQAAVETARTWQFRPLPEHVEAVAVELEYRIEGNLPPEQPE